MGSPIIKACDGLDTSATLPVGNPVGNAKREQDMPIELMSKITCPICGQETWEAMPTDACRYFFSCTHCGTNLRPVPGDCCVFCSYGSVPCPPKQAEQHT
jgi:hypothetical protein